MAVSNSEYESMRRRMYEMDAMASDHREVSEAQAVLIWLKEQSNNTILYVLEELNVELNERDPLYAMRFPGEPK